MQILMLLVHSDLSYSMHILLVSYLDHSDLTSGPCPNLKPKLYGRGGLDDDVFGHRKRVS